MTVDTPIASVSLCDTWRPLEATAGATFTGVATNLPFPPPHFCLFLSPCIEAETRKKERPKIGPVFPAAVSREKVGTIFTSFLEFLAAVSLGDGGPPLCYHLPFCVRRLPAAASSKLPLFFPFFFPFFKNVFSNYYFQPLFFLLLSLIAFSELKEKWASNINFFDWFSATIEKMKEILV